MRSSGENVGLGSRGEKSWKVRSSEDQRGLRTQDTTQQLGKREKTNPVRREYEGEEPGTNKGM